MNHKKCPVVKEALPFFLPLALAAALLRYIFGCSERFLKRQIWAIPGALALFVLYFFRNPPRSNQAQGADLLAPADGKVLSVEYIRDEQEFIKGPAVKVTIFLSVFNVHINRSPVAGVVSHIRYQPGKFLPAYKSHLSEINERNYMGLIAEVKEHRVLVVQLVGLVARRIVCWSEIGDRLDAGERFGLMKFGSRVELYVPHGSTIYVSEGDKVKGGVTILGRLP